MSGVTDALEKIAEYLEDIRDNSSQVEEFQERRNEALNDIFGELEGVTGMMEEIKQALVAQAETNGRIALALERIGIVAER